MGQGVHLIAYADRFGGGLDGLRGLLRGPLSDFTGVHILPFFVPFDGDDAGFDPADHTAVDPRLGNWDDVRALRDDGVDVTADLIVNHVSASSAEFQDWLLNGKASAYEGMFLTFDRVFAGHATEAGIAAFYRPRPGLPFTAYGLADGTRRLVWTTFMPSQVDIDVEHPAGADYLRRVVNTLVAGGVRTVRIDAVGYAMKTVGTDSFMTEETLLFVEELTGLCRDAGLAVLVEVHAHYTQQCRIAKIVDYVYDFALPPLLLHAFVSGDTERLAHWLEIRPANAITVLDTHDGIGIIDAGPIGELPGLIDHSQMAAIFAAAAEATGGLSKQASVIPEWFTLPHQINSTFPAVLGSDVRHVLARAVQLMTPGLPQIYYVGLMHGANDVELLRATGQGRDINRHVYAPEEIQERLADPAVRALLQLVHLRRHHAAFDGQFTATQPARSMLRMAWRNGEHAMTLDVDVAADTFRLEATNGDGVQAFVSVEDLASARRKR